MQRIKQILMREVFPAIALNDDLFQKRITDSPLCLCGNVENTDHYFMRCPFYHEQEQS